MVPSKYSPLLARRPEWLTWQPLQKDRHSPPSLIATRIVVNEYPKNPCKILNTMKGLRDFAVPHIAKAAIVAMIEQAIVVALTDILLPTCNPELGTQP